jgi:DNA mismatch repair ATPase MutL
MKLKYILGATALSFVLAGTAYPQQEQEKEKPQQQEQKPAEQPKTQQRQEQQSANKQQQQEQKNEQKQQKQEQQSSKQQNEQQKQSEQANRAHQDQQKQVTKQQQDDQKQQQRQQQQVAKQQRTDERDHSDHGHGRIPDDRFRASFGREHHFRVGHFDNRRFQYGGYWFSFNEGWPVGWAYTDDFYIDFIDGQYYLIDLSHPGVQLLLVVD